MSVAVPIVRNDEEGERLWFYGGGVHVWKASAEETGGSLLLFEDHLSQGKATPLHIHPNEDEALYVLEGELLVHIDGDDHRVGPRGFAFAPRGVPHAFLVTSPEARILCLETPATAEAFTAAPASPWATTPNELDRSTSQRCASRRSAPAACKCSGRPHSIQRRTPRLPLPSSDREPAVAVASRASGSVRGQER